MPGPILLEGDDITFAAITIPPTGVLVAPGKTVAKATGAPTVHGKKICVKGDEKDAAVQASIPYTAAGFTIPGVVTAKVFNLIDQPSLRIKSGGKEVLLQGTQFLAVFEVKTPAKSTSVPPLSDPAPKYFGIGMFGTTDTSDRGL